MPKEIGYAVVGLVTDILGASTTATSEWLVRPRRVECGDRWPLDCTIYSELTGLRLDGGSCGRSMPPLFPGDGGRHRQRSFRDALTDILAPRYGFSPTLRIADFEVKDWINQPDHVDRMRQLLAGRM
ncbi:hypothetical protein FHR70_003941 [Microvirga lupini]|uniref:Uncharacterized protein n=1 Tax=Microvirga lupini TaxID=420324 RepID=A0A7W4VPB8_9HYPH|nr:hypothetical protein [Microvirga lupini]MBB3020853.1 hypothetical protein [Microvirga lupini]